MEFASRTFDPSSRVWLQDDRFRGTTIRASSLNRYAYVEGAPESFVDVLGFFRAAAALRAQQLAALNAAFQSALAELNRVVTVQARLVGNWSVAQMMASYNMFHASSDPVVRAAMDQIAREAFYGVTQHKYQQRVQVVLAEQAQRREAQREADRRSRLARIQVQYATEQQQIADERNKLWVYDVGVEIKHKWDMTVEWGSDVQSRRERTSWYENTRDALTLTQLVEVSTGLGALWFDNGQYFDEGPLCGTEMECFVDTSFSYGTITLGHTVNSSQPFLGEKTQIHEFGHVLDVEEGGAIIYYPAYGVNATLGWAGDVLSGGGQGIHDSNLMEQTSFDDEAAVGHPDQYPEQGYLSDFWDAVS